MGKSGSQKRRREAEAAEEQSAAAVDSGSQQAPRSKKARTEEHQSLFVRSLPASATNETLAEFFSQHFPVKHATVVLDNQTKTSRGFGFVTFTDAEDAVQAKEKLNNALLDGRRLKLEIAEPRHRASAKVGGSGAAQPKVAEEKRKREQQRAEARKPNKLIVRNLPWSIRKPDQLAELFRSYGKIKFSDLPSSKGKLFGFGFITFRGRPNAERAIQGLNGTVVDDRTIAVDWAVDKSTWEQQQQQQTQAESGEPITQKKYDDAETKEEEQYKASNAAASKKGQADFDEDEDLRNFMESHMDTLEEEEANDEDDEDDEDDDEENRGDEEEACGADLDQASDGEADVSEAKSQNRNNKQLSTDNASTVFVRNLPFTTTDEQLKAHFGALGAIRYARVVMDRATDKPSGKGFVCFFNAEDAESCVQRAPKYRSALALAKQSVLQDETVDPEGKYTLEGRVLYVYKAVSKEEATRLTTRAADARNVLDKDKRRLFLLSEGHIRKDSPLFALLPASEIQMREASARQRKKLIESNPSLHLSLTRLALRNLPRSIGSKELKALAREAVVGFAKDVKEGKRQPLSKEESRRGGKLDREGERQRKVKKKGVVLQAKVVFETKDGSKTPETKGGDGVVAGAKSRRYGFIEYSSHRWALMGLRWLNGLVVENSKSGKSSRIIAEFAIENANVVARRKATEERFKGGGDGRGPKQQQQTLDSGPVEKNQRRDGASTSRGSSATGERRKTPAVSSKRPGKEEDPVKGGDDVVVGDGLDKKAAKSAETRLAMRQQIIGRKRLMRKKKTVIRRGK